MLSNVLDREPTEGVNPHKFFPLSHKVLIKRKEAPEKIGRLFMPEDSKARKPTFEGTIVRMGENPPPDYTDLKVGDRVVFSYQVDGQDSAFLLWEGERYAVIPWEAIQVVLS